ncbi:hypothetical protein DSECCO2_422720 [anaerobic digester metagenome]
MNKFENYKENGLTEEAEKNFNVIRGVILGALLKNEEKKKLCDFVNEMEEYFNGDVEEDDE